MTGIRELFAEFSGDEPDWFQMQFWFEREAEKDGRYYAYHQKRAEQDAQYAEKRRDGVRRAMATRYKTDDEYRARKLKAQRDRNKTPEHRTYMREYMRRRNAAKRAEGKAA